MPGCKVPDGLRQEVTLGQGSGKPSHLPKGTNSEKGKKLKHVHNFINLVIIICFSIKFLQMKN